MGLYDEHVLPRALAWGMAGARFAEQRAAALRHATGRVLELGFGAGLNLPHYPAGVTEVLALEPARVNRALARRRIATSPIPVTWVGLRGEEIPLDAHSVDAVTSTWTMCTIPDLARALGEVRRVLRPGGVLHFLEHGLAPEPGVARWQHRLTPVSRFLAGGCHMDRAIDVLLRSAGFGIRDLEHPRFDGPRPLAFLYRGRALPED
jgi:ubiquinone/menaquinone biosynthesis C-methylase UbiE